MVFDPELCRCACGSRITLYRMSFVADSLSSVEYVCGIKMYYSVSFTVLCGGIQNATSAVTTMTSPEFYPPFTSCVWTIDSPPQESVKLTIQNFNLPPGLDCSENYLELSDLPVVLQFIYFFMKTKLQV